MSRSDYGLQPEFDRFLKGGLVVCESQETVGDRGVRYCDRPHDGTEFSGNTRNTSASIDRGTAKPQND